MRSLLLFLAVIRLFATDLSGTWKFDIMLDGKNLTPVLEFRQQGEKLEGSFGKTGTLAGYVKGSRLSFRVGSGGLLYQGDIETAITLKGRILDAKKTLIGAWTAEKK